MITRDDIFARIVLHNKIATQEQIFKSIEKQLKVNQKNEKKSLEEVMVESGVLSQDQAKAVSIAYEKWTSDEDRDTDIADSVGDSFLITALQTNGKLERLNIDELLAEKKSLPEYKDKSLARFLLDKEEIDEKILLKIAELQGLRNRGKNQIIEKLNKLSKDKDDFFIRTAIQNAVINSEQVEEAKKQRDSQGQDKHLSVILVEEDIVDPVLAKNVLEAEPEVILVAREFKQSSSSTKLPKITEETPQEESNAEDNPYELMPEE